MSREELESLVQKLHKSLFEANEEKLTDPLTKIGNRRKLDTDFESLAIEGDEESIGILMLDLDNFKALNDIYGHSLGDHALKMFTEEVSNMLREDDFMYRYGGEEFIVIVKGEALIVKSIAERIRAHIDKVNWQWLGLPKITVSIGCSQGSKGTMLSKLLSEADEALYIAKGRGRNQTAGLTEYMEILEIPESKWPM
jgi:diguanylate cyclase (GGDEF)-like protein